MNRRLVTRHLPLLLVAATMVLAAHTRFADADEPKPDKPRRTVELTIDYGDGFQKRYTQLKATAKMTVLEVLSAAKKHPRGIDFKSRGKGETAFVTQIDQLKNEGAGRNWIFSVNGKQGKRSCGVTFVEAGDKVLWRFSKYSP